MSAGNLGRIGGKFGCVGETFWMRRREIWMRCLEFLDASAVNLSHRQKNFRRACTRAEVISLPMQPIIINLVESVSFLE